MMSKVIVSISLFMKRRYKHCNFFSVWWWSFLSSRSVLWEWTPIVSEKHNSKNIWHHLSHVLVRVLRKESVWGQNISAFSRWSLWVIDFVFMGISVEVISCWAPVILLRSNARETHRQHSSSIMLAWNHHCSVKIILWKIVSCHSDVIDCWLKTRQCVETGCLIHFVLKFYISNPGSFEHSNETFGSLKLEFRGEMRCC